MYNYLVEHAYKNVWCNTAQDNQVVISGPLITKNIGAINRVKAYGRDLPLPTQGERYHVYQIGQCKPSLLGIKDDGLIYYTEAWTTFAETVVDEQVWVDVCTENGVSQPRYHTYFIFTKEKGLLIAVPVNSVTRKDVDRIFLRVYSNAYLTSTPGDANGEQVYTYGKYIRNTQDVLDFEAVLNPYLTKEGGVVLYRNGFVVGRLDLFNLAIGDYVEFMYDSTIVRDIRIPFSQIDSFVSTLDSLVKYLIRDANMPNNVISFYDDNEIMVCTNDSSDLYKGYYYLRTRTTSARNITHRDYGVPVDYIEKVRLALNQAANTQRTDDQFIRLIVREASVPRPLIFDNNRIFELYKLPDDKVKQAMIGIQAPMELWNAAYLENATYAKMMAYPQLNIADVQNAYGYNAASYYLGNTPQKPEDKGAYKTVQVPYGYTLGATAYEYDADGFLIDFYYHDYGTEYICNNYRTAMVEFIYGRGTYTPEVFFGTDNITILPGREYRVYMAYRSPDNSLQEWKDITGSPLYRVENGVLLWNNLETDYLLMVRTDRTHLAYSTYIEPVDGVVFFTLSENENRGTGLNDNILPVPLGDLDIWLNGKALVRNIGYYVDFPKVYITDVDAMVPQTLQSNNGIWSLTGQQKITVRFAGFASKDLEIDPIEDSGFIQHGYLSRNYKFDIRDDKVLRMTVGGGIKHRSDLEFAEDHDQVHVINAVNGQPYQIKDIIVPVHYVLPVDTYAYRQASIDIDNKVSDYMTIKLPEPAKNAVSTIVHRYTVYSPFMQKLIMDIKAGHFDSTPLSKAWSSRDIPRLCAGYEYLLAYDPTRNEYHSGFVNLIPHNLDVMIDLNLFQFRFINEVVKFYFDGKIDLTNFIRLVG